jgi:purine-nucleoside phosphorylase
MAVTYYRKVEDASEYIKRKIDINPEIAIILGSGMGSIADKLRSEVKILYSEIPNFPTSSVKGHSGNLLIGKLADKNVLIMQGRIHYYEGYSFKKVTFPIRVMQLLGIKTIFLTNAAGGINPDFKPGDIMLIKDHLNLAGISGHNPLRGENDERFGTRFPDMSNAYDKKLRRLAAIVSKEIKINLKEGVYAYVSGPNFETPAEVRFLNIIGADTVGMSTVPEVIAARHAGMKVLAISGISNSLTGIKKTTYSEVLRAGKTISPKIGKLLEALLKNLNKL